MRKRGEAKSKGRSPGLSEEHHCQKARATRKIDLAKPQQADCRLFTDCVNNWIRDFQLFLFDFDGLLVNTEHLHYQAYVNALAKRGFNLELTFADFCSLAHVSSDAWREAMYSSLALDIPWDTLYRGKKEEYLELVQTGKVELMPGVKPLLQALKEADIRRCVVTHSPLEQTKLLCAGHPILQTIPHWITREDYQKPKPDPECYLRAIQLYGNKGDKIIGFEDSIRGLKALAGTPALPVIICANHYPHLQVAIDELQAIHYESFLDIKGMLS